MRNPYLIGALTAIGIAYIMLFGFFIMLGISVILTGPDYTPSLQFGIIEYQQPDGNFYKLYDNLHNYTIADKVDGYADFDQDLYASVSWDGVSGVLDNDGKLLILHHEYKDGEVVSKKLENEEDLPRYIKVDTSSGEVASYQGYSDIPAFEKEIYDGIQNGKYEFIRTMKSWLTLGVTLLAIGTLTIKFRNSINSAISKWLPRIVLVMCITITLSFIVFMLVRYFNSL